jgi:hypothetical protein
MQEEGRLASLAVVRLCSLANERGELSQCGYNHIKINDYSRSLKLAAMK